MKPEPPPITIVDPNAPSLGPADLLDHGPDRWRPSSYQKALAVLVAAIVALISGGVAEIRHVHHERCLDAAAVAAVELEVSDEEEGDVDEDPQVTLLNRGPQPLHLLAARLVGEGYAAHHLDTDVDPETGATVPVMSGKNCRPAMYNTYAEQVEVRARTSRGDVVTRTLALPPDVAGWIGYLERDRCGYLRPDEALFTDVVGTEERRGSVVVSLSLANSGIEPLTLSEIAAVSGLHVRARLPVHLDKRRYWTGASKRKRWELTLRVTDCDAFAQSLGDVDFPDEEPLLVQVVASNGYVTLSLPLPLVRGDDGFDDDGPSQPSALRLLENSCPATGSPGAL